MNKIEHVVSTVTALLMTFEIDIEIVNAVARALRGDKVEPIRRPATIADEYWYEEDGIVYHRDSDDIVDEGEWSKQKALLPKLVRTVLDSLPTVAERDILRKMGVDVG